jgi:hypothetical protein
MLSNQVLTSWLSFRRAWRFFIWFPGLPALTLYFSFTLPATISTSFSGSFLICLTYKYRRVWEPRPKPLLYLYSLPWWCPGFMTFDTLICWWFISLYLQLRPLPWTVDLNPKSTQQLWLDVSYTLDSWLYSSISFSRNLFYLIWWQFHSKELHRKLISLGVALNFCFSHA